MAERIHFFNNVLDEVDGELVRVGHKCKTCGRISFPATEGCMYCGSDDLEPYTMMKEGTLYSYSVCRRAIGPFTPPLVSGFVDYEDGSRVFAQIHADESEIHRGMKMKTETGVLYTKEDGTEVMGYWYIPVKN